MRLIGQNLSIERGGEFLFSGLDFDLGMKKLLTVTGSNGAGKSTLLRIIAGLLQPTCGFLTLETEDLALPVSPFAHYLGETNAMKPQLSVGQNLAFWSSYYKSPGLSIEEALQTIKLPDIIDLPFGVLSTGQRRRVAIARLLLSYKPLWIVDEPTSGLDEKARQLFSDLLAQHLDGGGMVVAATHLPLGVDASLSLVLERPEEML